MKCLNASNLRHIALFLILCITNCSLTESILKEKNKFTSNSDTIRIKYKKFKKLPQSEGKDLGDTIQAVYKDSKKFNFKNSKYEKNNNKNNNNLSFFQDNKLPVIISFSAFSLGFIFAGLFMFIAYLSKE